MEKGTVLPIEILPMGGIFYKKNDTQKTTPLQLHKVDNEKQRYICVNPVTKPELRSKEFLQVWLKRGERVVYESSPFDIDFEKHQKQLVEAIISAERLRHAIEFDYSGYGIERIKSVAANQ